MKGQMGGARKGFCWPSASVMLLLIWAGPGSVVGVATGMVWLPGPGSTPEPSAPLSSVSSTPGGSSALGPAVTGVVWIGVSGWKSSTYAGWIWGGGPGGAGGGDNVREMAGSASSVRPSTLEARSSVHPSYVDDFQP